MFIYTLSDIVATVLFMLMSLVLLLGGAWEVALFVARKIRGKK